MRAASSATLAISGLVLYFIGHVIYNLLLHPLRAYPGPLLWRMSRLPDNYHLYMGTVDQAVVNIHKQYGDSVRVAPDELSYTQGQAMKEIYSHIPGKQEFSKDPWGQQKTPNGIPSILGADKERHTRYRRLLAHGFSEKGLQDQESHIRKYVNLLMDRLSEKTKDGETTDMVAWYNMTVLDVIGDLAFGESFESLENRKMHDWIPAISGSVRFFLKSNIVRRYGLDFLIPYSVNKDTVALRMKHLKYIEQKVDQWIQCGKDRGDFWDRIMIKSSNDNQSGEGMTKVEMFNNAGVLVLGGSETSATTLSGMVTDEVMQSENRF